ncbi:hypothetical protein ASAP_0364 [Asaia bogorensis]|uniref:Uncharacterized protein n=1 Tax=Asaia bogorensis TaxID=91915 RepID=A0A060QBA1_9PROT|nr:hypothetical protein ASAP_0364 [Asaia bogorensis]
MHGVINRGSTVINAHIFRVQGRENLFPPRLAVMKGQGIGWGGHGVE